MGTCHERRRKYGGGGGARVGLDRPSKPVKNVTKLLKCV